MGIKRKVFENSGTKWSEEEVEVGLFLMRTELKLVPKQQELADILPAVERFVDAIGKDRLVNICEYRRNLNHSADGKVTAIVVWYWE